MAKELKLGNIKPIGADNIVVESKYVKGGYTVVASIEERDTLKGPDGKNIIDGSLCYCQEDTKFYQYNGNNWEEASFNIKAEALKFGSPGLEYEPSDDETFAICVGMGSCTLTDVVIASEYNGKPVRNVSGFRSTDITSIVIPDSVWTIEKDAFDNCLDLKKVVVSDGVLNIKASAFSGCTNLVNIKLPDTLTNMEASVFKGCSSLTDIYIPRRVTSICEYAFEGCTGLKSIVLPNNIQSIGVRAFYGCTSLTSIVIPDSVTSIGDEAFSGCDSLTNVVIGDSVKSIGEGAFNGCTNLTNIFIPKSVEAIGSAALPSGTQVYCAAEKKPENWDEYWTADTETVHWGAVSKFNETTDRVFNIEASLQSETARAIESEGLITENLGKEIADRQTEDNKLHNRVDQAIGIPSFSADKELSFTTLATDTDKSKTEKISFGGLITGIELDPADACKLKVTLWDGKTTTVGVSEILSSAWVNDVSTVTDVATNGKYPPTAAAAKSYVDGQIEAEAQERNKADTALGERIDTEIKDRTAVDDAIKASAVGIPNYNDQTGVITFKTLDGKESEAINLPIEWLLTGAQLDKTGTKLELTFRGDGSADGEEKIGPIEVDLSKFLDPAWVSNLSQELSTDEGSIPPNAKAVKAYVDTQTATLTNTISSEAATRAAADLALQQEITNAAIGVPTIEEETLTFKTLDGDTEQAYRPTEKTVVLSEDLYTYTPVGLIEEASNTNPKLLGFAGNSLQTVFNNIFGTQQDEEPIIDTSGVELAVNAGKTNYGSSSTEYGTTIEEEQVEITFTLKNSGTTNYGYRCGDTKITGSQTFYYPVTKQSTGEGSKTADLVITLPYGKTASSEMVTAGTFVSASGNILYCNFNSSKKVSIEINLPEGKVSTSSQTRYGQISASVELGAAQKEDQLTAGTAIDKFLTYLGEDATETAKLSGGTKTNTAGAYTISKGSYYNYCLASAEDSLSTDANSPVTNATRFTSTSVKIPCTTASYIWFLLPPETTGSKKIQYEPFANTWVDAFGGDADRTNGPVDVALQLNSGDTATYKGYYTSAKAAAGSNLNYKIV